MVSLCMLNCQPVLNVGIRVLLLNVFLFYDIFLLIIYFFTVYFTLLTVPKDKGKLKFLKKIPKHIYTCSKTTHKHRPPLNVSSHKKNAVFSRG